MIRKIIKIDQEKCNGCALCAKACHEGAISMINGKAVLVREDHCDGLGDCLPACPVNAISFEEREAKAYDAEAVALTKSKNTKLPCGCPGTLAKSIKRECEPNNYNVNVNSRLAQWPCQIKLVPVNAPYFDGADVLIAADCTAYAYGNFHNDFMSNRITLIGCPKLDQGDYTDKLTQIFSNNKINSITVTRMDVPCCGGLQNAVERAIRNSGKDIRLKIITITTDGKILY